MKKYVILIFTFFLFISSQSINALEFNNGMHKDRVIVKLKEDKNLTLNKAQSIVPDETNVDKVEEIDNLEDDNLYVIKFEDDLAKSSFNNTVDTLEEKKEIVEVFPSYKYTYKIEVGKNFIGGITSNVSSDFWHMNRSNAITMKNKIANKSDKVIVGVLDSGVDVNHEIIKNNIDKSLSRDFSTRKPTNNVSDYDGHGTHVAGLITDSTIGTGKNVKLVAMKVLDNNGDGSTESIIKAINHAQNNNIKILNMSLGYEKKFGVDELLYSSMASYNGIALVAAGNDARSVIDYPAGFDLDNIISVGSINQSNAVSNFSNYHKSEVDIYAPGSSIISACTSKIYQCNEGNKYIALNGTSMATPIVTGIFAANYSVDDEKSFMEIKNTMMNTVTKNNNLKGKALSNGYINGDAIFEKLQAGYNNKDVSADINGNQTSITVSGKNNYGQLGLGHNNTITGTRIVTVPNGEKASKVYTTSKNIYIVTTIGNLYVSGANDYNQLNQYNTNQSNSFVEFNKINNTHKVKSISFFSDTSVFNENSIRINLEDINGKEAYYKLGTYSYKPNSKSYQTTKGLQYVEKTNNNKTHIKYYKPFTNQLNNVEDYVYKTSYFYGYKKLTYQYNKLVSYYPTYNSTQYTYNPNKNKYSLVKETISNKKGVKTQFKQYKYQNTYRYSDIIKSQVVNTMDHYYYNNNGKITKRFTYKYNTSGKLIGTKTQYPYRIYYVYSNGKLTNKYRANYNTKGKLGRSVNIYKYISQKKYNIVYSKTYSNKLSLTSQTKMTYYKNNKKRNQLKITYNGKKRKTYLNRNYTKNKVSKDIYYKYNKYGKLRTQKNSKAYYYKKTYKNGKLKTSYRWTYNNKGKKINKVRLK